ncbi:MAG: hypothetical protein K6G03_06970 [Lachnospiraceae bacterium]|nr:hypothetical protein [Lachnospiraceae bacterium]
MKLSMEELEQVSGGAGVNRPKNKVAKNTMIRIACKGCGEVFEADIEKDIAVCPNPKCHYQNHIVG